MINSFYLKIISKIIGIVDFSNKQKIVFFLKNFFLKKKITIVDIGAHKGETVDVFLKNFSINKIFSFEPNKLLFSKLVENEKYKINKNIEFFNCGIGEKKEIKDLKIYDETSSSGFNDLNEESKYYKRKNKVLNFFSTNANLSFKNQSTEIISLSDFFGKKNIDKLDILKIDSEGYEYSILKGLKSSDFLKINLIYFEHHYNLMLKKNYTFSMIDNLLKKNGFFRIFKIKMKFRKSFEYIYKNSKSIC